MPRKLISTLTAFALCLTLPATGCGRGKDESKAPKGGGSSSPSATDPSLAAHCLSTDPTQESKTSGQELDTLLPIASVSKIMTAYWAVKTKGVDGRFETRVHVRRISGSDKHDVHIEGTRDPYSDQAMFQYVIGQLNAAGITKVRKLSYDENFKFKRDLRGKAAATAMLKNHEPIPATVEFQIKAMLAALNADYEFTRVRAAALGAQLPATLTLEIVGSSTRRAPRSKRVAFRNGSFTVPRSCCAC